MNSTTTSTQSFVRQDSLIKETFTNSKDAVRGYIFKRIGSYHDAEDIMQDVFIHLLSYTTLLNEKTILNLIYTIARNLTIDYLRRHANGRKAQEYFSTHARRSVNDTEQMVVARDIERMEWLQLSHMSERKAQVYKLCVHQGFSVDEIADTLSLNVRTVENHLFMARQQMRKNMKMCL